MTIAQNEAAAAVNSDGQASQDQPQGITPHQVPSSAWDPPPTLARALAYVAMCLFEALEVEPYEAPHGLDFKLRLFRNRMIRALSADQSGPGAVKVITAAESEALTPAEARERVAAKRAARLAADPWPGCEDELGEVPA